MRMLYRVPGKERLHGILCDYCLVPDTAQAIAEAEVQGWRMSPALALEATQSGKPAEIEPPRKSEREELIDLAESLGIKVDGRWSIARLRTEIDKKDGDE